MTTGTLKNLPANKETKKARVKYILVIRFDMLVIRSRRFALGAAHRRATTGTTTTASAAASTASASAHPALEATAWPRRDSIAAAQSGPGC